VEDVEYVEDVNILPRECAGHRKCWFYAASKDPREKCQMHASMDMLEEVWWCDLCAEVHEYEKREEREGKNGKDEVATSLCTVESDTEVEEACAFPRVWSDAVVK